MRGKIKTLAILTIVLVVVLSGLGLAKYLHVQSGSMVCDDKKVTLKVSCLTHFGTQLTTYLNGYGYHFHIIEKICLPGFVFLLAVSRTLLIRKMSS